MTNTIEVPRRAVNEYDEKFRQIIIERREKERKREQRLEWGMIAVVALLLALGFYLVK